MTAAELLRNVTRALSSASEDELPGVLARGEEGTLGWDGETLSVPVPGVGALRLAARRHPDDADLARAGEELTHALQELRELARGIHPAVLTERGLEPAIRAVVSFGAGGSVGVAAGPGVGIRRTSGATS